MLWLRVINLHKLTIAQEPTRPKTGRIGFRVEKEAIFTLHFILIKIKCLLVFFLWQNTNI